MESYSNSENDGNRNQIEGDGAKNIAFAPNDPLDGRELGGWKSRYPDTARKQIASEARYVGFLLVIVPALIVGFHLDFFRTVNISVALKKYSYAWLGGTLGGILFSIKWLYHSVARNLWNEDRLLWRVFTPHISGALSFSFVALISSGLISLFSANAIDKNSGVIGLSFLIGYFSDSAIAKLTEVANTIFGATRHDSMTKEKGRD